MPTLERALRPTLPLPLRRATRPGTDTWSKATMYTVRNWSSSSVPSGSECPNRPLTNPSNLGNIYMYTFAYCWYPIMTSRAGFAFHNEYSWLRTNIAVDLAGDETSSSLLLGLTSISSEENDAHAITQMVAWDSGGRGSSPCPRFLGRSLQGGGRFAHGHGEPHWQLIGPC